VVWMPARIVSVSLRGIWGRHMQVYYAGAPFVLFIL
jgi:hypothetical protein